jgi:hypothetical protein
MILEKPKIEKILYQFGTWKINIDRSIALCEQYANEFEQNFVKKLMEMQDIRIAFSEFFEQYFMSTCVFNTDFTFRHYFEAFGEKLMNTTLFHKPLTTTHYYKIDNNCIGIHKDIWCHDTPFYTFEVLDFSNEYLSVWLKEDKVHIVWEFDADQAYFPKDYAKGYAIMNQNTT